MVKLAANLSLLFTEHAFLDRFEAAANAGFKAVEFLFPYDYPPALIQERLERFGLQQALFNAPPGDWDGGERGLACIPGREEEFAAGITEALRYAHILGNRRIHVMAGIAPATASPAQARACYIRNLRAAAQAANAEGISLMIEAINNVDMPGYFINYQEDAAELIDAIGEPNLRVQFDCYHCQMMQGDIVATFHRLQPYIDHVQIAGVPGRHEPDSGELNYAFILAEIDKSGYNGFVGCEYQPKTTTLAGLGWKDRL